MIAANIVEVDIDTVGCGDRKLFADIDFLVIKGLVISVLLRQQSDFFGRTSRTDNSARAQLLGNLANRGTHGASSTGDKDGIAFFHACNRGQAHIGS